MVPGVGFKPQFTGTYKQLLCCDPVEACISALVLPGFTSPWANFFGPRNSAQNGRRPPALYLLKMELISKELFQCPFSGRAEFWPREGPSF